MLTIADAALTKRGVYSVAEAARYARVPVSTLRRWFFPSAGEPGLRRGEITEQGQQALSFFDLVEAMAVRSLRVKHGVSLAAIRHAMEFAQRQYGVEHLFARADHRTFLDAQQELHIILAGEQNSIVLTGQEQGQQSFCEGVASYLPDVRFNAEGWAERYTAFRHGEQAVVLNPAYQFGKPVMLEDGYPADVLYHAVLAEGSVERAAEVYATSMGSVEAAYRYCHNELQMAD